MLEHSILLLNFAGMKWVHIYLIQQGKLVILKAYTNAEFLPGFCPEWNPHGPNEHSKTVKQRVFTDLFRVDPSQQTWATTAQNT